MNGKLLQTKKGSDQLVWEAWGFHHLAPTSADNLREKMRYHTLAGSLTLWAGRSCGQGILSCMSNRIRTAQVRKPCWSCPLHIPLGGC